MQDTLLKRCLPGCRRPFHVATFKDSDLFGENELNGSYCSVHAEVAALRKLEKILARKGIRRMSTDLYVVRITKSRKLANSRPCIQCIQDLKASESVRIKRVYYSTPDGTIAYEKLNQMHTGYTSKGNRNRLSGT